MKVICRGRAKSQIYADIDRRLNANKKNKQIKGNQQFVILIAHCRYVYYPSQ